MSYKFMVIHMATRLKGFIKAIRYDVPNKLGFYNTTPVPQPADVDQAETEAPSQFNTADGAFEGFVFGEYVTGAQMTTIMALIEGLLDDCRRFRDEMAGQHDLLNAIRTALVDEGLIKGSA